MIACFECLLSKRNNFLYLSNAFPISTKTSTSTTKVSTFYNVMNKVLLIKIFQKTKDSDSVGLLNFWLFLSLSFFHLLRVSSCLHSYN